jgi:hypothetical protein
MPLYELFCIASHNPTSPVSTSCGETSPVGRETGDWDGKEITGPRKVEVKESPKADTETRLGQQHRSETAVRWARGARVAAPRRTADRKPGTADRATTRRRTAPTARDSGDRGAMARWTAGCCGSREAGAALAVSARPRVVAAALGCAVVVSRLWCLGLRRLRSGERVGGATSDCGIDAQPSAVYASP